MIFTHSGNSGDIIYSVPTIHHLTGGENIAHVYIKAANYIQPYNNQCEFVRELLLQQPSIKEVHPFVPSDGNWAYYNWPGLKPDFDLDRARGQSGRGRIFIVKRYFDTFGVHKDYKLPWLTIDDIDKRDERFALIHLTPRWNGLQYDWAKIYKEALERHGKVYFIGFQTEWLDFTIRFGAIEHLPTETLLQMARLIRDCEALYCNQNVSLTIAQGLGKDYYLVKNADKTNCFMGTGNEHLLGIDYLSPYHTLSMPPNSHQVEGKLIHGK